MDKKIERRGMLAALGLAVALAAAFVPGAATATAASACPITLPQGSERVTLDPAHFGGPIDNRYWPMAPRTRWVYKEGQARVHIDVKVRTKQILGITATVVHDVLTDHGELVEATFDWYAQDDCGNIWYLGEDTKEYENGVVVSTAGSWQAGVNGAQAGVIVPADPVPGLTYREEYLAGEAEDAATVLSTQEQVQVPYGHFRNVLLTKNYTPLEPRVLEYKFYARGIGPVLALGISGGSGSEELIKFFAPVS